MSKVNNNNNNKFICKHGAPFISDADKMKTENVDRFYNSITLMGEFYNRMYKKSNPTLVIGRSLFELLTKELRNETSKCSNDSTFVFSVQFARLLLTQVRHCVGNSYLCRWL